MLSHMVQRVLVENVAAEKAVEEAHKRVVEICAVFGGIEQARLSADDWVQGFFIALSLQCCFPPAHTAQPLDGKKPDAGGHERGEVSEGDVDTT